MILHKMFGIYQKTPCFPRQKIYIKPYIKSIRQALSILQNITIWVHYIFIYKKSEQAKKTHR